MAKPEYQTHEMAAKMAKDQDGRCRHGRARELEHI
jgi:hypothetical protein